MKACKAENTVKLVVTGQGRGGVWRCVLALAFVVLTGCTDEIVFEYGTRSPLYVESVNGTHVFSEMFESYGHRVVTWRALSPKLSEKADVIVWFSKSFEPPPPEVRDWLDAWLFEAPGRTLIYVGRDYDAARPYLEGVKKGPPPLALAQVLEIDSMLTDVDAAYLNPRGLAKGGDGDWFSLDVKNQPHSVRKLNGSIDWVKGLQAPSLEIELVGRMRPGTDVDVLLEDDKKNMILGEINYDESRILLIPNGSYLLNLPLVNQEHRKLAGRIVDAVGEDRYVVFLESDGEVPEVMDKDPTPQSPSLGKILAQPPLNTIVFQAVLAGLGLIFAFVRLPIFGVPRTLATTALSDFGRHVTALGELLMHTRDRQYAVSRVLHYQQLTRKQKEPVKIDRVADAPRLRMPEGN
jgi:hypothetical protein